MGEKKIIVIVGRPNVGKSTLFNRLARKKRAIVEDTPGVTRDKIYLDVEWDGVPYILVDTGGLSPRADTDILQGIHHMAETAVEEADVVIFLTNVRDGLMPEDESVFSSLRKRNKKVYVAVNKADTARKENEIFEFYSLGVEKLYPISAQHNVGISELMDDIFEDLMIHSGEGEKDSNAKRIAIVGRPNVGKSSIINRILGFERVLVHDEPGTTRDSIDTMFHKDNKSYIIIDTAGIRRKSRIFQRIEKFSVSESLKSIDRADIVIIVLDGTEATTDQDAKVAHIVQEKGKGILIVVNKWDLVYKDEKTALIYEESVQRSLIHVNYAPILFISAKTGKNIPKIFELVDRVSKNHQKRISTGELNSFFEKVKGEHLPGIYKGKQLKLYYITQPKVSPPTFIVFANNPKGIKPFYTRYMVNRLREEYDFSGTPIRIFYRQRD